MVLPYKMENKMNRIDTVIYAAKVAKKKILSPYITAGDPDILASLQIMHALVNNGADILEIGMPFSDPMAEGPVIQAAMERALKNKVNCEIIFALIQSFREKDQVTPIILMGYLNPIECFGYEKFAQAAAAAGVDGTIIVDLPPEESAEISKIWDQYQIYPIYLCSPTTTALRMKIINQYAKGYLYFVSLKGVTGSNAFDLDTVKLFYEQIKKQTHLPLMVGFGIKTPEIAAQVAQFSDGVIVGAALIQKIAEAQAEGKNFLQIGPSLIQDMRKAIDNERKND